jgi:hypothetical protein
MAYTKPLVLLSLIAILAAGLAIVPTFNQANAVLPVASPSYREHGTLVGTASAAISKELYLKTSRSLSWILTATGGAGTFNSTTLTVSVSEDGTNWKAVDTISLSTTSIKGGTYNDLNEATTISLNVVDFPYVKFSTSAGVGSVTERLVWTAR